MDAAGRPLPRVRAAFLSDVHLGTGPARPSGCVLATMFRD